MIADDFADIAQRLRAISPGLMLDGVGEAPHPQAPVWDAELLKRWGWLRSDPRSAIVVSASGQGYETMPGLMLDVGRDAPSDWEDCAVTAAPSSGMIDGGEWTAEQLRIFWADCAARVRAMLAAPEPQPEPQAEAAAGRVPWPRDTDPARTGVTPSVPQLGAAINRPLAIRGISPEQLAAIWENGIQPPVEWSSIHNPATYS